MKPFIAEFARKLLDIHKPGEIRFVFDELGLDPTLENVDRVDSSYWALVEDGYMEPMAYGRVIPIKEAASAWYCPYRLTKAGEAMKVGASGKKKAKPLE